MTLEKLYNNVQKMNANTLANEVFREAKIARFVLDLNRENQLFVKGVGVDGQIIGKYSYLTEQWTKGASGKGYPKDAGEHYNFYDTGEMYNSFRIRVEKDGFVIDADAEKIVSNSKINVQDENEILGLTKESMELLVKEIIPELAKEVRKQILQ